MIHIGVRWIVDILTVWPDNSAFRKPKFMKIKQKKCQYDGKRSPVFANYQNDLDKLGGRVVSITLTTSEWRGFVSRARQP